MKMKQSTGSWSMLMYAFTNYLVKFLTKEGLQTRGECRTICPAERNVVSNNWNIG